MRKLTLASRMRDRVTIQQKNLVDNGRGGRKQPDGEPEWLDIAARISAEVIALRGDQALANGVTRNTRLWRVTIRNRSDLDPAQRVVWGNINMDIRVIAPSDDREALVMTCESGVPT